jgi:hypothetical protein
MQKAAEEFAGGKAESTLEKRSQHHNVFDIGCWDVFPFHRPPLEHGTVGEKVVLD